MTTTRRTFLGLAAAGAGGIALPGCSSGSGGDAGGGGGSGPIRVAWYGGAPVHEGVEGALAAWGASHPDQPYAVERAPFDDYWDKLATQTAGRDAPDVFRMSMSYFSDYAGRGALRDLSGAVGSTIRTTDLDPDVASSGQVGDELFGIGQSSISHAVFVSSAVLEDVGASLPGDWTWEQFGEFARGFSAEAGPGSWGSQDLGGNLQLFDVFARQHGTDLFGTGGSVLAVPVETVAEWFRLWDDLRRDDAVPPGDVSAETGSFETSLLAQGKSPLAAGWVQQVTFYQPLVPDSEVSIVPLPSLQPGDVSGQFLKALDLWCVSGTTEDPETAEAVVDFLVNDPAAAASVGITLGVPPSERARTALAADAGPAPQRAIEYVEGLAGRVGPSPEAWPSGYGELLSAFDRLNQDIAFDRSDPAAAAQAFAEEAGRVLG